MKLKYNFVVNDIAGKKVAVAVGEDFKEFGGFIKMNGDSAKIFAHLKNDITKEELINAVKKDFPAENEETVRENVLEFVKKLDEAGALINE